MFADSAERSRLCRAERSPLSSALVAAIQKGYRMNEIDILKKLSSNLTERKSIAALSNYEVLCNNISFSHDLLEKGLNYLKYIIYEFKQKLINNSVRFEYQSDKDLYPFVSIVPRLLSNDLEVINKLSLHTIPDVRDNINESNVEELHRGFIEYNNLVTATRQLVDSLVTDSYQMQLLDPKEFNYHVLLSLNSFDKYATKSLRQGLFNDDVEDALNEFRNLSSPWRRRSAPRHR